MTRHGKLFLALLALSACGPKPASDVPHAVANVTVTPLLACSADSLCYALSWQKSTDAKGDATSYLVTVTQTPTTGGVLPVDKSVTTLSTTFAVLKPDFGVDVTFGASVKAVRRGQTSAASPATTWHYKRPDAPPPPPGGVTVDSSQIVSMLLWPKDVQLVSASTACRAIPDSLRISNLGIVAPDCMGKDSLGNAVPMAVRFCAFFKQASGRWSLSSNSATSKPCQDHLSVLSGT